MRKSAIRDFTHIKLTQDEMANIFLPDKRIVCKSCKKVRIKKFISKYGFNEDHLGKICRCDEQIKEQEEEAQQQVEIQEEENDNIPAENISNHSDDDDEIQNPEFLGDNNGQQDNNGIGHNSQNHENHGDNNYVTRNEFNQFKNEISGQIQNLSNKYQDISDRLDRTDRNMKEEFKKITKLLKKKKK